MSVVFFENLRKRGLEKVQHHHLLPPHIASDGISMNVETPHVSYGCETKSLESSTEYQWLPFEHSRDHYLPPRIASDAPSMRLITPHVSYSCGADIFDSPTKYQRLLFLHSRKR